MKRHWSHWLMFHYRCHPAKCKTAAQMANAEIYDQLARQDDGTGHRRWN